MSSLATGPVRDVLERLHADAETKNAEFHRRSTDRPHAGGPLSDSRTFFEHAKDVYLAVSPTTGTLLYTLVRTSGARSVVEFGTSFGISTIYLAAGVSENGGGQVIGSEYLANKVQTARANVAEAGLADVVDVREGDALERLAVDVPESIDLIFLDGAKELYLDVLTVLELRLHEGSLVVADNASRASNFLDHVRSTDRYVCTSLPELDLEIALVVS